jgi:hypothetical protein
MIRPAGCGDDVVDCMGADAPGDPGGSGSDGCARCDEACRLPLFVAVQSLEKRVSACICHEAIGGRRSAPPPCTLFPTMTGSKTRATAKKAAPRPRRLTKAQVAHIDAKIDEAKGSPGFEMVRSLGELAKLGPYDFKKRKIK